MLDATGVLEAVLDDLGVESWQLEPDAGPPFHPGRSAKVSIDGTHLGLVGEIHPRVAASVEIDGPGRRLRARAHPVAGGRRRDVHVP